MSNFSKQSFDSFLYTLKRTRQDFSIVQSETAMYIKYGKERIYKDRDGVVPPSELFVFGMVQRNADKYLQANPQHDPTKPDQYKPIPPVHICGVNGNPFALTSQTFCPCAEIDISSAYSKAAYQMGIIEKNTYYTLLNCSKQARLAAIGSLASVKRIEFYESGKIQEDKGETVENHTRQLFFLVASQIEKMMKEILSKYEETLFYWVDAIFCPEFLTAAVCRKIKQYKFDYKIKRGLMIRHSCEFQTKDGRVGDEKITTFQVFDPLDRDKINEETGEVLPKTFQFSKRNFGVYFNLLAAAEKKMIEIIKARDIKNIPRAIVEAYGTDNLKKINMNKVLKALNQVGLNYKDVIFFEQVIQLNIKEYQLDADNNFNLFLNFYFAAEVINQVKFLSLQKYEQQKFDPTFENGIITEETINSYTRIFS